MERIIIRVKNDRFIFYKIVSIIILTLINVRKLTEVV